MIKYRSARYFTNYLVFASVVAATLQPAFGQELGPTASCSSRSSEELNKLEKVYSIGDIRVFWTDQAPAAGQDHRLPPQSTADSNSDGVPDYIENIARQADAARQAFIHLGFQDPLNSPRYAAVRFIDINILNMAYNGRAYDSAVYYPDAPGRGSECTLRIDISARLETRWIGPLDRRIQAEFTKHWFVVGHEVFHLFQYGLTQFKRAWINEPTAKWAEYVMRRRGLYPLDAPDNGLPRSPNEMRASVIDVPVKGSANRFWSKLIVLADATSGEMSLPEHLRFQTYTDGEPVFKDNAIRGAPFILAVFEALAKEDRVVSGTLGLDPLRWPENTQTSSDHDALALSVIQRVVRDLRGADEPVDGFLSIE
ncbi:hypothetical protein FY150_24570 (plasmid) [Agrobacterium tumefaciens]|nr:hypothetical protein FY150_24570 [Agrobacterium tumefaciens]